MSDFNITVDSLFKGMDNFINTKTVVGDAIHIDDTIILPLVDVSFGMAAGAFNDEKKNNGGGGIGAKISPSAVLVIKDGVTKMISVKDQSSTSKLIDVFSDVINKSMTKNDISEEE